MADDISVISNEDGIIDKEKGLIAFTAQYQPDYSKSPGYLKVRRYKTGSYTKKDGSVSTYFNYKLKKGRKIARNKSLSLYKNRCVARGTNATSRKSGDKQERRLYVVMKAKSATLNELDKVVSQIAFALKTKFKGATSWQDLSCKGTIDKVTNKVIVTYVYYSKKVKRPYGFSARIERIGAQFHVTNQVPDKDSDHFSNENDITGVYEV